MPGMMDTVLNIGLNRDTLQGFIETRNGKVTRFDVIAKGVAERVSDCGFSASLLVVPKGIKVPAAVAFTRAGRSGDAGGSGGGDWDSDASGSKAQRKKSTASLEGWMPTIEEILRAWACDPAAVRDAAVS